MDEECTVDVNDPDYTFTASKSYLDFFLLVGTTCGIDTFIPLQPVHDFTITVDLHRPTKQFRAKYGTLGFNPSSSMLYVGSTSAEDLWLALAPEMYIEGTPADFHLRDRYDSRLSARQYRMIIAFLAQVFQSLEGREFYVTNPYEFDPDGLSPEFDSHTNLM